MILVVDNYDSFTYNLVQYVGTFRSDIQVLRNDTFHIARLHELQPERIILSPGPGRPENAGLSVEVVRVFGSEIPILGVCLGHQAIAVAYGASVVQAPEICHGKTSAILHENSRVLDGLPSPLQATRYHSLVVDEHSLPPDIEVTARTESGLVMGIEHRSLPVSGLQFHPESILTEHGLQIIENFITRFE
jgi:anthranilate synthase/aminodeoxychorismate synthase-like glutamine amidotransferase